MCLAVLCCAAERCQLCLIAQPCCVVSCYNYAACLCSFALTLLPADDNTLLVTSQWRSSTALLAISLDSGAVRRISQHDKDNSCWLLAAAYKGVNCSTVVYPDTLPHHTLAAYKHVACNTKYSKLLHGHQV